MMAHVLQWWREGLICLVRIILYDVVDRSVTMIFLLAFCIGEGSINVAAIIVPVVVILILIVAVGVLIIVLVAWKFRYHHKKIHIDKGKK
jgi:hypothetical protein